MNSRFFVNVLTAFYDGYFFQEDAVVAEQSLPEETQFGQYQSGIVAHHEEQLQAVLGEFAAARISGFFLENQLPPLTYHCHITEAGNGSLCFRNSLTQSTRREKTENHLQPDPRKMVPKADKIQCKSWAKFAHNSTQPA